ncbi:cell division protein FtsQ [Pseudomonas batumici]|uniref:cell division protein FtsQ n=1 Tax=Pseudomonas batumici TaxID=226910 RepID=UPI0030CC0548
MNRARGLMLGLAVLISPAAAHADTALYPTGPGRESGFIRFVNALGTPLEVRPEGKQPPSTLAPSVVSVFSAVPADKPVRGTLSSAGISLPVTLNLAPEEFVSLVAVPGDKGFALLTVREQPQDFNRLQASLALINADPGCTDGGLRREGRQESPIFHDLNPGLLERRDVNPVQLAVQGFCDGTQVTEPLNLGLLEAGERYTVLLLSRGGKPVLVFVRDAFAQ